MKVLAGVDGSQKSLDAIRFTARILDPTEDRFLFFYRPPEIRIEHEDQLIPAIPADMRTGLIERVFDEAQAMLPVAFQANLETAVGEQKPSAGLLLAAEQAQADLIIVGADAKDRGFGPFLGGVARKVAREAPIPVLVFRAMNVNASPEPDQPHPLHVILAHDGTQDSTLAGQQLDQFRWPTDTIGTIVRVMDWIDIRIAGDPRGPSVWNDDYEKYVAHAIQHTNQELLATTDQLPAMFHERPPIIEQGTAVETLCDVATSHHADLIVVGPHGNRLGRRVLGATTESLLHYAPCSVLVSHQRQLDA
jgi:nucleotide-binding universal stress UspA family protein